MRGDLRLFLGQEEEPHQQFSGDVGALCAYFAAP
jgi:hypothetical protein